MLAGLMGDVSGVNSNGVWMLLSIASKLERPDEGLVSDEEGRVSGVNGVGKLVEGGSKSGSVVGCFFLKRPELSLRNVASIAE